MGRVMRGGDQGVTKATLAVALHPSGEHWHLTHDLQGIAELVVPLAALRCEDTAPESQNASGQRSSGTFTNDQQQ
ncbi:hypothetical protein HRbin26_01721 [bacterium HR26]|nr:hypothetical protein HRbin26_01721 [bacterium HR26]